MKKFTLCMTLIVAMYSTLGFAQAPEDNWPSWRGPLETGFAPKGNPPVTWSETENVKWKVAIPGSGSSTPIVWGNKLFLQTAKPSDGEVDPSLSKSTSNAAVHKKVPYTFSVLCIDRSTGKKLWEKVVREEVPHQGHHPTANYASYSPVTDGNLLWASFGSRGLHCFDLDGNLKWSKKLIQLETRYSFGESSSPTLAGDAVVVLLDHEGESKIAAYNKTTGDLLWEKSRDEATSWSTPVAVQVGDTLQVITCATNYIRSYNAKNGDVVWQCSGLSVGAIPSPLVGFGNVYCSSSFKGDALMAIRLDQTGDISDSDAIVWQKTKHTPYVPTPLLYGDYLYFVTNMKGMFNCFDAKTGEILYQNERIEGSKMVYASPIGVAGKIYIADRDGQVTVLKEGTTFEVLAQNQLDEGFDASPVVVGNDLYLRGTQHLYCIANQ